jgi:hypothetical protein
MVRQSCFSIVLGDTFEKKDTKVSQNSTCPGMQFCKRKLRGALQNFEKCPQAFLLQMRGVPF